MSNPTILETAALAWSEIERFNAIRNDNFDKIPLSQKNRLRRVLSRLRAAVDDAWGEAEALREEAEATIKENA